MILKHDIAAAKAAVDKLNAYSDGVFAAGGRDATAKYRELNAIADKAINKLPAGFMRSREGLKLAASFAKRFSL